MDDLKEFLAPTFFTVAMFGLIIWGIIAISYNVQNVHLKVFVQDKLVYDGRSACVEVESAGYATSVQVTGGWYCLFPKENYTDKDVRVETLHP